MAGRRETRDARRRTLLAAIMATFAARGFQGAGIAEIAAASGVAPANLYRYFASKEEMVRAIVAAQRSEIAAQLAASIALAREAEAARKTETPRKTETWEGSPRAALRHFLTAVIAQATAPLMRALWLEILAEAARNPGVAAILREDDLHLTAAFAGLVRRGMAAGEIPSGRQPESMARLLIALMDGAMARAAYDSRFDLAGFMAEAEATLLNRGGE